MFASLLSFYLIVGMHNEIVNNVPMLFYWCLLFDNPDLISSFSSAVANDDASLVKHIGKSFRLSAVQVWVWLMWAVAFFLSYSVLLLFLSCIVVPMLFFTYRSPSMKIRSEMHMKMLYLEYLHTPLLILKLRRLSLKPMTKARKLKMLKPNLAVPSLVIK